MSIKQFMLLALSFTASLTFRSELLQRVFL